MNEIGRDESLVGRKKKVKNNKKDRGFNRESVVRKVTKKEEKECLWWEVLRLKIRIKEAVIVGFRYVFRARV